MFANRAANIESCQGNSVPSQDVVRSFLLVNINFVPSDSEGDQGRCSGKSPIREKSLQTKARLNKGGQKQAPRCGWLVPKNDNELNEHVRATGAEPS